MDTLPVFRRTIEQADLSDAVVAIVAGCTTFAGTDDLATALVAVIVVRLVVSVSYPIFVARSIPGSAVPARTVLIALALLGLSLGVGAILPGTGFAETAGMGLLWLVLAGAAAWFGLLPRATVQALIRQR